MKNENAKKVELVLVPVITVLAGEVEGGGGCCAVEVGVVSPRVSGGGGDSTAASSTSWRSMVMISCPASLDKGTELFFFLNRKSKPRNANQLCVYNNNRDRKTPIWKIHNR